jgi:L-glyceraldehyde 3-phosphate reductase
MTSALIGASRVEQIEQNVAVIGNLNLTPAELRRIEKIIAPTS